MDGDQGEIVRLCCTAASAVVIMLVTYFGMLYHHRPIPREPSAIRDLYRHAHMHHILYGSSSSCTDYLRMRKGTFFHLAQILRNSQLLQDTVHVPVEEQLAMFLHILGHKSNNRVMRVDFIRSGETISRYFNKVLGAICILRDQYMKQAPNETPSEVESSTLWYPYFSDCIGLIDGTHIDATIPTEYVARFRGRKGTTQNVLAAALPNKRFTYVLAGWEGSANDFTVLKDALALPPPNGLRLYEGMDESSRDPESPHHETKGSIAPPHTGGFTSPPTQSSRSFGYIAINQMMMGMNMNPRGSSGPIFSGGYQHMMDPIYGGMIGGSNPPPGYNFPMAGSPHTPVPLQQFLQSGMFTPVGGPSPPPFSGMPSSSHSEKHTTDGTSSSKKSRGIDESDVSSPVKKSKRNSGKNVADSSGNKFWDQEQDDYVIRYLAELARQGYKADKTFKVSAFSMAAGAVNRKFGTNFGYKNVQNHYRSLKTRFQDMCGCFLISGAGWDEEKKIITLDPISFDRWDKKNTKLKEFVNKPLENFDELRLIVGDDFANGEFKKSVYDKFGKIPFSSFHDTNDPLVDPLRDAASAEDIVDQPIGGGGGSTSAMRIPNPLGVGGGKSTKPRKRKQVVDEDVMNRMVEKVGDLSDAIRQTAPRHWTEQLSQCVYGHLEFDDVVLDTAFARLFESEMTARFFITKPLNAQKRYLGQLAMELKRDVPTSRERVENVSSSEEEGDGGKGDKVDLTS